MKVVVMKSEDDNWYKNMIGKEFNVEERVHPTFKYREYILENTEENKKKLDYDELELLFLRGGFTGINYIHACKCNKKGSGELEINLECGYHNEVQEYDFWDLYKKTKMMLPR